MFCVGRVMQYLYENSRELPPFDPSTFDERQRDFERQVQQKREMQQHMQRVYGGWDLFY
jgi:hypothetical protein